MKGRCQRLGLCTCVAVSLVAVAGGAADGSSLTGAAWSATAYSSTGTSTLTISSASGEEWPCSFNPFNPNTFYFSLGIVNEELYYIDPVTNKMTPWLATSYLWSHNHMTLTWQIRKGVRFTDGALLTAGDVAYTFELLLRHPALDVNAIDANLASVDQRGPYSVVMHFRRPAATDFYYIADQTPIVPEIIWSKVRNPVTYVDANPIGTGPYTVQSCTPQNISYIKNSSYWQPGKPKFDRVEVPALLSNNVANELLATGGAQWGGQFIPDLKRFYLSRNSGNRSWFPPYGLKGVFINLTNPILSSLAVRQALAYSIDRPLISKVAEYGEEPPANQAGVALPVYGSWYNGSLAAKYDYRFDPAKAVSLLESAGLKRGSDGTFQTATGQPLDFNLINVGAYSDRVSECELIATELGKVGIKVNVENLSSNLYDQELSEGDYDLALGGSSGRTVEGPFGPLRSLLYSPYTAPIGKVASSDYERYSSTPENRLFDELATTSNPSTEQALMKQIQAPMLTEVPFIPVVNSVVFDEYNVRYASGWPSASNPYASPGPSNVPDFAVVLIHLVPKQT